MKKMVLSIVCCFCFTSLFSQSLIRGIKVENPDDTDIYFPSSLVDSITFVPVAPGQYQQAVWTDGNATLLPLTSKIKVKAEESKDGMIVITDNENFDFLAMTASNHIIGLKEDDKFGYVCIIDTLQTDGIQDPILIYGDSLGHAQRIIYDYLTMDILYKEDGQHFDILLFDGTDTLMVRNLNNPYYRSNASRTRAQSGRDDVSLSGQASVAHDILGLCYNGISTAIDINNLDRLGEASREALLNIKGRIGDFYDNIEHYNEFQDALQGRKKFLFGCAIGVTNVVVIHSSEDNHIVQLTNADLSIVSLYITAPNRQYPCFSNFLSRLGPKTWLPILDALLTGIEVGATINNMYEDYVAEMFFDDSWPVTGDCVHLGKRYVVLKTHVPIIRSGSSFKVGAMLGDTHHVSQGFWRNIGYKNYIEKQSVDVRYNFKDAYNFIFEIDPNKKDYRYVSILEPADESEYGGINRAYDFFRYGSQTKSIEPGNSCIEFTVKQTSVRRASAGSDYIFAFDVIGKNPEPDMLDWGCALYREHNYKERLDLQKVSKENFTGEATFKFEAKVFVDEESNTQVYNYEICPYTKIEETVICDPEYDAVRVKLNFDPNVKINTDGYKAIGNNKYYAVGRFSGVEKYDAIGICYFPQNGSYADAQYSQTGSADTNGYFGVELQLKENTSYNFCAYIEVEGCKYLGELMNIERATIETVKHEKVSDTSYRLYGSYSGYDTQIAGFVYNTNGDPTIENANSIVGEVLWDGFNAVVTNLAPGTKYYYRAFIKLDDNYIYGETKDFETGDKNNICPDNNHPHLIDLGLPSGIKWSCCDYRATKPENVGAYRLRSEIPARVDSKVIPSLSDVNEMASACEHMETTINGVKGALYTSKNNGNMLFFPYGKHNGINGCAFYWCGETSEYSFTEWSGGGLIWTPDVSDYMDYLEMRARYIMK